LERELRDGVERRMLAVGDFLASDGTEYEELHRLVTGSLVDIRDFARGVHPRTLTEHGLAAAVGELAHVAGFPVELDVTARRLPAAVEAAVYFVCSEALANVAKHAGVASARVRIATTDRRLMVEIADDGPGGADAEVGSGLAGLADRIAALGGTFQVDSPPTGGTRLVGEIPI
jgi:signal transduction histidine kinase